MQVPAAAAPAPVLASIVGFDGLHFTITVDASGETETEGSRWKVQRTFKDLQVLSRAAKCSEGIPSKAFKKLIDHGSWTDDGSSSTASIKRSLIAVRIWLQLAICSLDSESLAQITDDELYASSKRLKAARKSAEAGPRQLQQYFASECNIEQVVDRALAGGGAEDVYLEPSCGDGRIVLELLRRGAAHVLGVDIDAAVGGRARSECQAQYPDRDVRICVRDFLTTSRAQLGLDRQNLPAAAPAPQSALSEGLRTPVCGRPRVVVVGGPPFTIVPEALAVAASSADRSLGSEALDDAEVPCFPGIDSPFDYAAHSRSDFPLLFLRHCALELCADKIVFILPERCAHPTFVAAATAAMNGTVPGVAGVPGVPRGTTPSCPHDSNAQIGGVSSGGALIKGETGSWAMVETVMADYSFTLVGRAIRQPAVIQAWHRSTEC
mmetsp:Transcript_3898/g.8891  ORF Transcript_3898/g.8891 Transcript_3898/m.8891 type:complete len:437 (-) Transcript_3898:69-1379(-)